MATNANLHDGIAALATAVGARVKIVADAAAAAYVLPSGGIPKTTLDTETQGLLAKAGTALQTAPVTSVAAKTGAVTLVKGDVGLGNVDNTADTAKPISTAVSTALASKADLVGGLIPTSQIPALALHTSVTVASQAAMLALTTAQVQAGDLAIRTDGAGTFILGGDGNPATLANWTRLNAPTDAVTSVNGQTGTVALGKSDVGLGNVDNTSDVNKPVSTATASALTTKYTVGSNTLAGSELVAGSVTLDRLSAALQQALQPNYSEFIRTASSSQTTTTLAADAMLTAPLAANSVYLMTLWVYYTATFNNDLKVGFTLPAGVAFDGHTDSIYSQQPAGTTPGAARSFNPFNYSGTTAGTIGAFGGLSAAAGTPAITCIGKIEARIATGSTSGQIAWQFAMNAATDATATVILPASRMSLAKVA